MVTVEHIYGLAATRLTLGQCAKNAAHNNVAIELIIRAGARWLWRKPMAAIFADVAFGNPATTRIFPSAQVAL
jgi:hypothetical protein